jgi:XTP/dITP diphosphohydrolase
MTSGQVKLLLATGNAHKLREVSRILAPYGIAVEPLPDGVVLPPEVGDTFAANALPKARTAARQLGRRAIADDSGIEADALGGAPGVRSARFAGEHAGDQANVTKLLAEAPPGSRLRYVCVLAYVDPTLPAADRGERLFFGESRGRLTARPRGDHGFGYDPAFLPDDGPAELTMAELEDRDKDAISHRGRALRAFAEWYVTAA